jgi:hypothetical protein
LGDDFNHNCVFIVQYPKHIFSRALVDGYLAEIVFRPTLVLFEVRDDGQFVIWKVEIGEGFLEFSMQLVHLYSQLLDSAVKDYP